MQSFPAASTAVVSMMLGSTFMGLFLENVPKSVFEPVDTICLAASCRF